MNEEQMPAAEASTYELAFHVLPTVAEGEVATVFDNIKKTITKAGGDVIDEEAPERFDLAYDIVKYLEGRNRKFSSAYFGWIRFTIEPEKLDGVATEIEAIKELLRHLLVKLTKVEEENPFRFHEALAEKKVRTVEAEESTDDDESDEDSSTGEQTDDDGEDTEEKV